MRFLYPVLFLYFRMLIFGPLVAATISAETFTPASALASVVTSEPSTTSRAGNVTVAPAAPSSFSISTVSPTATLYCLPPVLTMAYTDLLLAQMWGSRARWRPRNLLRLPDSRPGPQTVRG